MKIRNIEIVSSIKISVAPKITKDNIVFRNYSNANTISIFLSKSEAQKLFSLSEIKL